MGKNGKRSVGRRCMIGGCSNLKSTDYSVFEAPDETRKRWEKFVLQTRTFSYHGNVHICSGHFVASDFNTCHIIPFALGHRKSPPLLIQGAVPTSKSAIPYHELFDFAKIKEQFTKSPIKIESLDLPTHRIKTPILSTTGSTCSTSTTSTVTTTMSAVTTTTVTTPSSPTRTSFGYYAMATPSTRAVDIITPSPITTSQDRSKRLAAITRRKLVDDIVQDHEIEMKGKKLKERRAMFPDSGMQTDAKIGMTSKKLQMGRPLVNFKRKNCAVQCTPFKNTQATQAGSSHSHVHLVSTEVQTDPVNFVKDNPHHTEPEELDDSMDMEVDDDKDSDYEPSSESSMSESESDSDFDEIPKITVNRSHQSMINEPKYLVFESELLNLFKWCPKCKMPCTVKKRNPKCFGSMIRVHQACLGCDYSFKWDSQPRLGSTWAGNVMISASILYAGTSPKSVLRVFQHLNLQAVSYSTFMEHQRLFLQPAIALRYRHQQQEVFSSLQQAGTPLVIGGDARCDSPGHSAKFGSYTLMDLNTSKIVDTQLVQSNETTSSNAMELEGLKRGIEHLRQNNLEISTLITDRHVSVNAHLRKNEKDITHYYDIWHVAKGLKKKLTKAEKLKQCEVIGEWKQSIINHVYWTASSTPDADSDVMETKFRCILNHVKNVHEGHGEHFNTCAHGELEPREWIAEDSKAYDKLQEIMTKKSVLKDVRKLSPVKQTSKVEAYHGVILYFAPKLLCFSYQGMKCRLYLSVLHWNENGNRPQALTPDGSKQYTISYPKAKRGGCVVKKTRVKCTYKYVAGLMEETLHLVATGEKDLWDELPELQAPDYLCSRYEHPDKADAVATKEALERFARSFDATLDELDE